MAEQELALVDKVELRIALASSDTKFQSSLDLYLCPLLLKLASPHSAVRQQILKFIQNVIPRLNAARAVQLPTVKLLEQALNPKCPQGQDPSTVQLYSLLFASKGVDRLTDEDKHELIPTIVKGIHTFKPNVAARLFYLFLKSLKGWKTPDRGTDEFKALREKLAFDEADELFIIRKIEQLFLLNPVLNNDGVIPKGYTCPGLSAADVSFLTYDAGVSYKGDELSTVKKDVAMFISILSDKNNTALLEIGSVDSNDVVGNACAALLRKITVPYEDETTINHIISLYVGDKSIPRSPVKPAVQERLITVLSNSVIATKHKDVPLITSIGLNASRFPRLKAATIQFIQWVAKNGSDATSSTEYSITVAAQLRNNLHAEGWPRFEIAQGTTFSTQLKHRRLQYEALGDILKKDALLIEDFSFIEFLFDSLVGDIPETRTTIQGALGSIMHHLPSLPSTSKSRLKSLMRTYLQDDDFDRRDAESLHAAKFTALKYINATFPFHDAESRILNILGTSTKNRSDIIEEAHKGLHPYWFNIAQSSNTIEMKPTPELMGVGNIVQFPSFQDVIEELGKMIEYSRDNKTSSLHGSMATAVEFILRVLVSQAIKGKSTVVVQDQEWGVRLDKGLELDATVIEYTKAELVKSSSTVIKFLDILATEFASNAGKDGISNKMNVIYGKTYVKLLSLSPQNVISTQTSAISKLMKLIKKYTVIEDGTVNYAANAIGIIASHPSFSDTDVIELFKSLHTTVEGVPTTPYEVLLIGYLLSRLQLRQRPVLSEENLREGYTTIVTTITSSDLKLQSAAVTAVAELSKFGGFGPKWNSEFIADAKKTIVQALEPKVKKLDEKAIIAWALLSLSEGESIDESFTPFEASIFNTHNTKQVETLFTSGEAFSILAAGWDSNFLKQLIDIQDDDIRPGAAARENRLDFILTKVLEACSSTKPSLTKAGCIWLLSLSQYCGHLPALEGKSGLIHVAFMRFLSDRDELVQEAASRGLSIIYELGDNDLKETLVKSLLKSFTESTSTSKLSSGSVSADTELFEPGVLKTHDGSVSTYKDILNLASEVGDPSLVYKFMSMAKSSALWSSRKGIAFGLGSIMSKSSLDKMLFENSSLSNRLIPKLYRYRFDPSSSVSKSMNDIWATIVPDTSKTVERYHEAILKELLTSMGNKEWRVREASTVALTDLIQTLPADKYQDRMEDIWTMGFRSLDDIKESVRKAGGGLTRVLSQMLVNSISVESGSSATRANEALSKLLPFLLGNKGILSDAEDVRNFSLKTILDLVKKAGKAIRPFIGELLEQFILLMSTLEPQIINYLALNADKYKISSDDIDAKRMQSIGSSPMMNALEKLVDLVDDEIISDVVFRLQSTVKKSVGLPSKAAASRVIVMLVIRHLQIVGRFGESLLTTCVSQLKDRNTTVSSSFATAAGYTCRVCSVSVVLKYAQKISDMYFDSEDDRSKIVAGIASEAVAKYSGDRFASVAAAFLPVAFVAKNDPSKEVAKAFESEWSENTSGNGAVKLYMQEICDLTEKSMSSSQFSVRQTAAKSIAKACNAIDGTTGTSFSIERLFSVLLNACQGRSWSGKEDVLAALVSLSTKCKEHVLAHGDLLEKINRVVLTEAKRRNKEYQKFSIVSLGLFAHDFPSVELQDSVIEIFDSLLSPDYYDSDDENDSKKTLKDNVNEKSTPKNLKREADRIRALKSLSSAFVCYETGKYNEEMLIFVLNSLKTTVSPEAYIPTWRSQISAIDAFVDISKSLKGVTLSKRSVDGIKSAWDTIYQNCTPSTEIENVRVQTVRVGGNLIAIGNEELSLHVKQAITEFKEHVQSNVLLVEIKNVLG